MARIKIPDHTRTLILLEAGYKCANPVCRHILTLELHHIVWVKDGGKNDPENLLALCPNCHSLHTQGHIAEAAIRKWKSLLVALNSTNQGTADLLLLIATEEERFEHPDDSQKGVPPRFRFTGDGLPYLAGLITSGLLQISKRYSGANAWGGGMPSFEVQLTDKGMKFVDAWKESGVSPEAESGET